MIVSEKLEVGDYFIIRNLPEFAESTTLYKKYQVDGVDHVGDLWFIDDAGEKNFAPNYPYDYDIQKLFFVDLQDPSIARPVLEERKVGKVKMQLFDEGFPNAIMEIAKVMSWAETAKGYQPNDFKNLPNADTEFAAAASRHRVKSFIQKTNGVSALGRTDEESNIVHLAHAAFNILAELELVLTGKIK